MASVLTFRTDVADAADRVSQLNFRPGRRMLPACVLHHLLLLLVRLSHSFNNSTLVQQCVPYVHSLSAQRVQAQSKGEHWRSTSTDGASQDNPPIQPGDSHVCFRCARPHSIPVQAEIKRSFTLPALAGDPCHHRWPKVGVGTRLYVA